MKFRVRRHAVTQPLDQSYRLIPLTQGQNAIVDMADFDWLNQWNWTAEWNKTTKTFYASRKTGGIHTRMHRVILGCGPHEEGDHVDRDTLNNRRQNLRKCTHAQNSMNQGLNSRNTSGRKGVSKSRGKWESKLEFNGKRVWIGRFDSIDEASRAYDEAAKRCFGEFAHLNFPSQ